MKECVDKQKRQIEHLKSNIEGVRSMQNHHDAAQSQVVPRDRESVAISAIHEMKQNLTAGAAGQGSGAAKAVARAKQLSKDLDMMEKARRAERNERTREAPDSFQMDEPEYILDDDQAVVDGLPDFSQADIMSDPLNLDGTIGRIGKVNRNEPFNHNHVRIANGAIVTNNSNA